MIEGAVTADCNSLYYRKAGYNMDNNFFSEDDLADIFANLDEEALEKEIDQLSASDQKETDASFNRFKEIIEKHRGE